MAAPLSRRARRALLASLLVTCFAWAVAAQPAAAGISWCRSDPVVLFSVEGRGLVRGTALADIFVSAPIAALLNVTGPNQIVVTTPRGVTAVLAISDLGFGRGEVVTFQQSDALALSDSAIQISISVFVPSRKDMPVEVSFAPHVIGLLRPAVASGRANQWVSLTTTF